MVDILLILRIMESLEMLMVTAVRISNDVAGDEVDYADRSGGDDNSDMTKMETSR